MTLSLTAETTYNTRTLTAHHVRYDQPESGLQIDLGGEHIVLTGEQTLELGTFLLGGHAAAGKRAVFLTPDEAEQLLEVNAALATELDNAAGADVEEVTE